MSVKMILSSLYNRFIDVDLANFIDWIKKRDANLVVFAFLLGNKVNSVYDVWEKYLLSQVKKDISTHEYPSFHYKNKLTKGWSFGNIYHYI